MADKVIICGLRRGGAFVPQSEILQMAGRCGRQASAISSPAVYLLAEDQDLATADNYFTSKPPCIFSQLSETDRAVMHALPDLCSGKITDRKSIQHWFSRSLAAHTLLPLDDEQVVEQLISTGMISQCGDKFVATPLAKIAVSYMFHPKAVQRWIYKTDCVSSSDRMSDIASLSWLLARKTSARFQPDFEALEEFTSVCDAYGYDMEEGEKLSGLVYYCLLTHRRPAALRYQLFEYKTDAPRVLSALRKIDVIQDWNLLDAWKMVQIQLTQGVDEEVAEFMCCTGIKSKALALQLSDMGFKTKEDIADGIDDIIDAGDKLLVQRVKELLKDGA